MEDYHDAVPSDDDQQHQDDEGGHAWETATDDDDDENGAVHEEDDALSDRSKDYCEGEASDGDFEDAWLDDYLPDSSDPSTLSKQATHLLNTRVSSLLHQR
ncbi:hypothetical protein PHMEG_000407 [Phytophthora megakarya]|uniref:Uncharacterized protein n=1 Tax=Phytophthora megakarya TaxID=4795 RepID=A0A225X5H9_9STRA|nr:hypothetical protein PHMEG_000407 [Phytophthora megakarya]